MVSFHFAKSLQNKKQMLLAFTTTSGKKGNLTIHKIEHTCCCRNTGQSAGDFTLHREKPATVPLLLPTVLQIKENTKSNSQQGTNRTVF